MGEGEGVAIESPIHGSLFPLIQTGALDMNQQQRIATWDEVEAIGSEKGERKALLKMAQRLGAPKELMLEWQSIEAVDVLTEAVVAWLKAKG